MKFDLYAYIKMSNKKERRYWWVCRENNNVSRIAIEKKDSIFMVQELKKCITI
ncbi:MAG: hypothetical protein IBV53_09840 [Candidatus Atribacteria bacterium]